MLLNTLFTIDSAGSRREIMLDDSDNCFIPIGRRSRLRDICAAESSKVGQVDFHAYINTQIRECARERQAIKPAAPFDDAPKGVIDVGPIDAVGR